MKKIVKEDLPLKDLLFQEEAIKFMEEKGEPYKVELIKDLPEGEEISFYKQGEIYRPLCRTSFGFYRQGKSFSSFCRLQGAYWRGNEKNKMLQRIYGTSYPKKSQLEEYLFKLEEAKKTGS